MTVLLGEGTMEIIYGSISIPAGAQTLGGYLARPDGEGTGRPCWHSAPSPRPCRPSRTYAVCSHGMESRCSPLR